MTDPKDRGPIEEWSEQELLDHYRYTVTELAGESGSEDANRPIDVLVAEIRRRGLPIPGSPAESKPDPERSAGEPGTEPEASDQDEMLSDQEEPPLIG
jgi:hypothetical protein